MADPIFNQELMGFPYHIHHIQLASGIDSMPEVNAKPYGNYLVFWWKSIPLGDVYLDPEQNLTINDYSELVFNSIYKSLRFYGLSNEIDFGFGNFNQNSTRWLNKMETLFSAYTDQDIPEEVQVSVIICTRNRPEQLQRCLSMVRELSCQPAEIIVVDNASDNSLTFETSQKFAEVKYIPEPLIGLDRARNSGIRASQNPIVFFIDDDVVVHPLCLWRIWETFQEPSVAAMTGLVIAHALETEGQILFEKHWSFNRGYSDKQYDADYFRINLSKGPPVWDIGAGANMAFRKDVFNNVGLFDEILDVGAAGCSGDSEMWFRILNKGLKITYNPRAVVYHEHRKELKALKKQMFSYSRGYITAALLQQQQNPKTGYLRHLLFRVPKYYLYRIKNGFPKYQERYHTLWAEISGLSSGLIYYFRNKHKSSRLKKY
ncbi:MAG: glycosyltransferase [Fulvivirga sp.]